MKLSPCGHEVGSFTTEGGDIPRQVSVGRKPVSIISHSMVSSLVPACVLSAGTLLLTSLGLVSRDVSLHIPFLIHGALAQCFIIAIETYTGTGSNLVFVSPVVSPD